MSNSASVTLLMAEVTNTGRLSLSAAACTISATRRIALGSATDVPPNFMTTMGSGPNP